MNIPSALRNQNGMKKRAKAIGLLSGGLDSCCAFKIILEQDIEVIAVKFTSAFCHCDREKGCGAGVFAKKLGIPLKTFLKGEDYLETVKNPSYGYGSGINPCIDCRIYMFKKAKEIMEEEKADFIFTGEVLNQRPFSQKMRMMELIDRKSGLTGKVVRPLSAKSLPVTEPEEKKIVDRDKFLDIEGRRRKTQFEIAEKFKMTGYTCPSGGCLLTDKIFSRKLREMFRIMPDCTVSDVNLLKFGRNFWYKDNLIMVGRDEAENEALETLHRSGDVLIILESAPSPAVLIRGKSIDEPTKEEGKRLLLSYTKKPGEKNPEFTIKG